MRWNGSGNAMEMSWNGRNDHSRPPYVRTTMHVRTCAAVPLLPKTRNLEAVRIFGRLLQKKHSATSEEAFRNIGRSIPQHRKKHSATSEEAFRNIGSSIPQHRKKPSATSEEAFRNIGRSLPQHRKKPSATSEEAFRIIRRSFLIC